jgi:CBS domain-containing protein
MLLRFTPSTITLLKNNKYYYSSWNHFIMQINNNNNTDRKLSTMSITTTLNNTTKILKNYNGGLTRNIINNNIFTRPLHSHTLGQLLVGDILRIKERHRWTVEENETVFAATGKMVKENVGALVVCRKAKPVGIVTERDYLRKVVHMGKSSPQTTVSEICTKDSDLIVADVKDSLQDCMDAMGAKEIRHLPVARDGDIVGIISIRDIAKAFATERDKVFRKLENLETNNIHDG